MAYTDELAVNCYYGIVNYVNIDTFTNAFSNDKLLQNVLYNLGNMYTDIYLLVT